MGIVVLAMPPAMGHGWIISTAMALLVVLLDCQVTGVYVTLFHSSGS